MKIAVIVSTIAVLAVGGAGGGYYYAKRAGEDMVRARMNAVVANASIAVDIEYGKVEVNPLLKTAIIQDISISWKDGNIHIDQAEVSDVDTEDSFPIQAIAHFKGLTDSGLAKSALALGLFDNPQAPLSESGFDWSNVRYDLTFDYRFETGARHLKVNRLMLSVPELGEIDIAFEVSRIPENLPVPSADDLKKPIELLFRLVSEVAAFERTLIHGASVSYRDESAINHVLDGLAQKAGQEPKLYAILLKNRLRAELDGTGKNRKIERALREAILALLSGSNQLEVSASPASPIPVARLARLKDEAEAERVLNVRTVANGSREMGRYATTASAEKAIYADFLAEAANSDILVNNISSPEGGAIAKLKKAMAIDPNNANVQRRIRDLKEQLLARARQLEIDGKHVVFDGDKLLPDDGALGAYIEIENLDPDNVEAKQFIDSRAERYMTLGERALRLGDTAHAERRLGDAALLRPDLAGLQELQSMVRTTCKAGYFLPVTATMSRCGFGLSRSGALVYESRQVSDPILVTLHYDQDRVEVVPSPKMLISPSPSGRFDIVVPCILEEEPACVGLYIYDRVNSRFLEIFEPGNAPMTFVSWSPDEQYIAMPAPFPGKSNDYAVNIIDVMSGKSQSYYFGVDIEFTKNFDSFISWIGPRSLKIKLRKCDDCNEEWQGISLTPSVP